MTTAFVHTQVGVRANLECLTTATPVAQVHWLRNGKPIVTHSNRVVRHDIDLVEYLIIILIQFSNNI